MSALTDRLEHSGSAGPTTLATPLTASGTSIVLTDGTGYPTGVVGSFVITIDRGTANEERILCATRSGNTVAVTTRGWDGSTAREHAALAVVEHTWSQTEADQANAHSSDTAAHGTDGDIVGTTDTQSLSNKTLASPTITGTVAGAPAISGNPAFPGNPVFSGAPSVGNFTSMQHDHGDADDGGNIPLTSVTGAQAALDAKVDDSEKGAASGVATLDGSTTLTPAQIPTIPFAKLPVGTSAVTVAQGDHTHDAVLASTDNSLTARALGGGDVGTPRSLATTDSLPAGTYLITASCAGFACASGGSPTRLIWTLSISTGSGTLYTGPIRTINDTVQTVAGATVVGILVASNAVVIDFTVTKDNDSGVVANTSTSGHLTATRLTDLT